MYGAGGRNLTPPTDNFLNTMNLEFSLSALYHMKECISQQIAMSGCQTEFSGNFEGLGYETS